MLTVAVPSILEKIFFNVHKSVGIPSFADDISVGLLIRSRAEILPPRFQIIALTFGRV